MLAFYILKEEGKSFKIKLVCLFKLNHHTLKDGWNILYQCFCHIMYFVHIMCSWYSYSFVVQVSKRTQLNCNSMEMIETKKCVMRIIRNDLDVRCKMMLLKIMLRSQFIYLTLTLENKNDMVVCDVTSKVKI